MLVFQLLLIDIKCEVKAACMAEKIPDNDDPDKSPTANARTVDEFGSNVAKQAVNEALVSAVGSLDVNAAQTTSPVLPPTDASFFFITPGFVFLALVFIQTLVCYREFACRLIPFRILGKFRDCFPALLFVGYAFGILECAGCPCT